MLEIGLTTLCARIAHVTRIFCSLLTLIRLHVLTLGRQVEAILQAKAAPLGYELIEADLENRIAALIRRVNTSDPKPNILVTYGASMPRFWEPPRKPGPISLSSDRTARP